MTCREFVTLLDGYVHGEIPEDQRAVFDRHLDGCEACAAYLETYRAVIRLGKAAFDCPDDEVPPEVPRDLVEAILALRPRPGTS
jgi:anti-sigma factor RsiW